MTLRRETVGHGRSRGSSHRRRRAPQAIDPLRSHTGEIVDVDGDVFGQNLVVAARLVDEAAPGEIVVSALTREPA